MEEEAFAAIKEAEADEVVVEEVGGGSEEGVEKEGGEVGAPAALGGQELGAKIAVAVHVLQVGGERGVGVVEEVVPEGGGGAGGGDGLVDGAVGEGEVGGATKEAEFGIGVEAAVADPAAEKEIAAFEQEGVGGRVGGKQGAELLLERGGELFVGVEGEDPDAAALAEGEVLLGGEALPGVVEDRGAEGLGDLDRAIGGAGVDDDDFLGPLNGGEGAGEVSFFVVGDEGDREQGRGGTCGAVHVRCSG